MSYRSQYDYRPYNSYDEPFVKFIIAILIVLGLGAVGLCVKCTDEALWPAKQVATVAERTFNADNMLYNYEWFHQQHQNVQNYDRQIAQKEARLAEMEHSLPANRTSWTREDRTELFQLQTELGGLRAMRSTVVSEYNAHSDMANRNIFRAGDLPQHIQ